MKAEDLMVGDWVHYKMDLGKDGIYEKDIRINNIYGSAVNCELRGYEIISGKRSSNLYPIPLTAEILEKNGFKDADIIVVGTRKFRWQSEDGRIEITIWLDDTMPMDIVKNVYYEDEVSYSLPFPWAVHILQHALRLCGIEKEIVV